MTDTAHGGRGPPEEIASLLALHQATVAASDATAKVSRLQRIVRLQEETSPLGPSRPILDMERSTGE